uniref:Uncharacterized protein n=1 Tax=Oryza glumipatula TaxID=40148 RepID=A0A0D9YP65_9ORYZ
MGDGDAGRLRFPWPGVVFRAAAAAHLAHGHALPPALTSSEGSPTVVVETLCHTSESPSSSTPVSRLFTARERRTREERLPSEAGIPPLSLFRARLRN